MLKRKRSAYGVFISHATSLASTSLFLASLTSWIVDNSMWHLSTAVFTSFVFQSASSSKSLYSLTEQWMAVIQCTCLSSYFTRVADVPSRLRLRSSTSDQLTVSLLSAAGPFQSPPPIFGTVSLHISDQHRRARFFCSVAPSMT